MVSRNIHRNFIQNYMYTFKTFITELVTFNNICFFKCVIVLFYFYNIYILV